MGREKIIMTVYKGKSIGNFGVVKGEALVTTDLVAFWAGTNWETGEIVEIGHEARGKNVAGKILVFPKGKGGAGDTFGYYYLARSGKAPLAMICNDGMGQTVAGALLVKTPMVYGFNENVVDIINTGDMITVDTEKGEIEIIKRNA